MFHEEWEHAMWLEDAKRLWRDKQPFPSDWNGKYRWFWAWHQDPNYTVALLPHQEEHILATLDDREKDLIEKYDLTRGQLQWRRNKISGDCSKQNVMEPEEYFDQEYPDCPEVAFISQGKTVFNQQKLALMLKEAMDLNPWLGRIRYLGDDEYEIVEVKHKSQATFWRFEKPQRGHFYVAGADAAEGLDSGDDSVIPIFDRTDGTRIVEVARLISKDDAEPLGDIAVMLCEFYNDAFLVPERNPPGNATCLRIVRKGYTSVYHHKNIDLFSDRDNPESFTVGFKTLRNTKRQIVEMGQTALRDGQIVLRHPKAIKQWKQFQNIDGKVQAPSGGNDDCVMADLLALFGHFEPGAAPAIWGLQQEEQEKQRRDNEIDALSDQTVVDADISEAVKKSLRRWSDRNRREEKRKSKAMRRRTRRPALNPMQ